MQSQSAANIFQLIELLYGPSVRKCAHKYLEVEKQEVNWSNHRVFNERCIKNKVIPYSLRTKPPDRTKLAWQVAKAASWKYLQVRQVSTIRKLKQVRQEVITWRRELMGVLAADI